MTPSLYDSVRITNIGGNTEHSDVGRTGILTEGPFPILGYNEDFYRLTFDAPYLNWCVDVCLNEVEVIA